MRQDVAKAPVPLALASSIQSGKSNMSSSKDYIEKIMIRKYTDSNVSNLDVLALQRLIADRSRGIREKSIQEQFEELKREIADLSTVY